MSTHSTQQTDRRLARLSGYGARAALRFPAILFFSVTTWYALLAYIPFSYLQFLRHELFRWVGLFVTAHHSLYWGAFLLALLSIADDLRARKVTAWAFAGAFGAVGIWQAFHPTLPPLGNNSRSLVVALAALVPCLWLSLIDHMAVRGRVRWPEITRTNAERNRWLLSACFWTGMYVWLTFAALAAVRLSLARDARVGPIDYLSGAGWSLALHLALAAAIFIVMVGIRALVQALRLGSRTEYALLAAALGTAGWLTLTRLVFPSISFQGSLASMTSMILGSAGAFVWSGLAVRRTAGAAPDENEPPDPITILMGPLAPFGSARSMALWLAAMTAMAYAAIAAVAKIDWHFLVQKIIAAGLWLGAFAAIVRSVRLQADVRLKPDATGSNVHRVPQQPLRWHRASALYSVAMVAAAVIVSGGILLGRDTRPIDRYAAYDASLTLLDHLMTPASSELADLVEFLVASSNISDDRGARPASVDFVDSLQPSGIPQPDVFLFVIDSLRRDYLSPYNPAVTFTPAIQAFARESVSFSNAFTRYGGTGLSEPAIWSGALLPHKQYVTPFAPMNALDKLLNAEGYRRLISADSILQQLLEPSPKVRELDAGIPNRNYDTCRTLEEIRDALSEPAGDRAPVFAFTQSQDLHLVNVAADQTSVAADAFPGFEPRYAARIQRFDKCFGAFIDHLKQTGVYGRSVVIITSDHGDSLGDEGRWGHAYTVFPEVMRVPLIVHVPQAFGGRTSMKEAEQLLAFTTDITPTLYKLSGHPPAAPRGPMFGITLIGTDDETKARRREGPYLLASSYGPVYGLLQDNGRMLYIVDGVNTGEYQYDLARGLNGERVVATDAERAGAWRDIRAQIAEVNAFYGIDDIK